MRFLVGISLNESDRRLLIALLIVALVVFLLLGALGMLIRYVTGKMSRRMDYEIHDAVVYRVIQTPEQLKKYGNAKNNQLFFRQSSPAILIALGSLLFYIVYSLCVKKWDTDFFGQFGTLFYHFDWGNPNNYAQVFGLTLLAKWPDLLSSPTLHGEYWGAYVLVPLWLIAITYYLLMCQAYMARLFLLRKRTHTVFEKSLDDFNFFDDVKGKENTNAPQNTEAK